MAPQQPDQLMTGPGDRLCQAERSDAAGAREGAGEEIAPRGATELPQAQAHYRTLARIVRAWGGGLSHEIDSGGRCPARVLSRPNHSDPDLGVALVCPVHAGEYRARWLVMPPRCHG